MARRQIAKVDLQGKKIKGKLADWIKKHPGELYFDSSLEWEVWDYIQTHKINAQYHTELTLFDTYDTTEYVPESFSKNGRKTSSLKKTKQRPIRYTPDYYLPDYDVYIEVKGYSDEVFKLRWKLFKLRGYTGYLVYSLRDFIDVLKLLEKN